jgi:hypothetical protein
MACPHRLELAGGLYHATSRVDGREDIYLDETAIRTGLDARLNRFGYFDQWVGALKNQVQHLDRVWCCDGKTLRTIET